MYAYMQSGLNSVWKSIGQPAEPAIEAAPAE
jgi:hypothetical protein